MARVTRIASYQTVDGKMHSTAQEAAKHDLSLQADALVEDWRNDPAARHGFQRPDEANDFAERLAALAKWSPSKLKALAQTAVKARCAVDVAR